MSIPEVRNTDDFKRVFNLPRRTWSEPEIEKLIDYLTECLRTPNGTMRLKPMQALGLHDAVVDDGLFGPVGVGDGKTLLSLLLPLVLGSRKSLLLLPANLIEKTKREREELSKHWQIPNTIRLFSYNMLGLVQSAEELEDYKPDTIICDEVHRLKNKRAAVTRRVARYMDAYPTTRFCGLSGSIMDKSIKEFAHLSLWALKDKAPVPTSPEEIEEWAEVLDANADPMGRKPGALLSFCTPEELQNHSPHVAARLGFRRRLTETPGVVATIGKGEYVGASIYFNAVIQSVAPVTEHNFRILRGDGTPEFPGWQTPDRWELMTAADVWRHANELALGLFYAWNPRPPDDWRDARRDWNSFVRETISRSHTYDSEQHVANAIDAGKLSTTYLERWRRLRPTFRPNVVPVWCDDSALKTCADWMSKPGIVWTEHRFFAQRLSKITGVPYFGGEGRTEDGALYIEDMKPGSPCIASIDANREGRNLQRIWYRNLFVCPPTTATWWEQCIARTHRTGQTADEVIVDVLLGCRENYEACIKAIESAKVIQQVTGKEQKLLLADITLPSQYDIDSMKSPRWSR